MTAWSVWGCRQPLWQRSGTGMRNNWAPVLSAAAIKCPPRPSSTELRKRRLAARRSPLANAGNAQAAAIPARLSWINWRRCMSVPVAGVEAPDNAQFTGNIARQQLVQFVDFDEDQLQGTVTSVIGQQLLQVRRLALQPRDGRCQLLIEAIGQFSPFGAGHYLAQAGQEVALQSKQAGLDAGQRVLAAPGVGNIGVAPGLALQPHGRRQAFVAQDLQPVHGGQHGRVLELLSLQIMGAEGLPLLLQLTSVVLQQLADAAGQRTGASLRQRLGLGRLRIEQQVLQCRKALDRVAVGLDLFKADLLGAAEPGVGLAGNGI